MAHTVAAKQAAGPRAAPRGDAEGRGVVGTRPAACPAASRALAALRLTRLLRAPLPPLAAGQVHRTGQPPASGETCAAAAAATPSGRSTVAEPGGTPPHLPTPYRPSARRLGNGVLIRQHMHAGAPHHSWRASPGGTLQRVAPPAGNAGLPVPAV